MSISSVVLVKNGTNTIRAIALRLQFHEIILHPKDLKDTGKSFKDISITHFQKTNYYRIPKEDFLPKAVNYDFLNE